MLAGEGVRILRRPQTKPLVFTPRARRLFGVALALPAVALAGAAIAVVAGAPVWVGPAVGAVVGVGGPSWRAPELLFAANAAVKPIQALDNRRFVDRAKRKLAEIDPLVIGITGSFGKTTTKACVNAVAELRGPSYATPASFNSFLGVVRAINEGLSSKHKSFVVEMGAYRRGDVAEICELVRPKIGVLTAIGPAHLERFGSLDEIEQAKGELAEALPEDGTYVTTADDERCVRTTERTAARVVLFSAAGDAGGRDQRRRHRDGRGHDPLHAPASHRPGRGRGGHRPHAPARPPQRREPARGRGGRGEHGPPARRDRAGRSRASRRPPTASRRSSTARRASS